MGHAQILYNCTLENRYFILILICFLIAACNSGNQPLEIPESIVLKSAETIESNTAISLPATPHSAPVDSLSEWETKMKALGLEKVTLRVDALEELPYSTADNAFELVLYADFESCYLQKEALAFLIKADSLLRKSNPDLRFKLLDCARPYSVQQAMWKAVAGTPSSNYVASPKRHSLHNYGLAVDLTLVDSTGAELDMGTPFDHFGVEAQPREEKRLLEMKVLTKRQIANREILRHAMYGAGFRGIPNEWWHFNAVSRSIAREKYPLLDF